MDMGSSIVSIYHADQAQAVGVIPKVCQENIVSMVSVQPPNARPSNTVKRPNL
jgi:hypothetical protein